MNEKMNKLWRQVKLQECDCGCNPDEFLRLKFAELIVKECVDICNQAILQNQDTLSKLGVDELAEKMVIHGSINQAQKLGKGIKQHFGVES